MAVTVTAGPFALIGNSFDSTISVIDTAAPVTVTATPVTLTAMPVAGIATNPVRPEAYVAALAADGSSVLTVVGIQPFGQLAEITLSVFEPTGVVVNPAGTRAYVTGGLTDNAVSVVDLDTRTELTLIMLHATDAVGPFGAAIHPTLARLYVANSNAGTISVIDTTTNIVVATITLTPCPVGCAPNHVAVAPNAPNGSRLYVTDDLADVVWVINTATNAVVTSVVGVLFPEGVAVHPDGSRVYVANVDASFEGQVTQIATATNTVTGSAPVGLDPVGVAVDPSGTNVYIVNFGDDTVTVASTADLTSQTVLLVGGAPTTFGPFITPGPGVVQFNSSAYSVIEGTGVTRTAIITVVRSGAPGATITVPFMTTAGTATAGSDYTETVRTLTFGPSDTSQTVQVPILADNLAESPETVNLVLGEPTGLARLGDRDQAVLTINDVGGGTIQFLAPTFTVSESTASGAAIITVTRSTPRVNPVTVTYTATPLTAVADQDFTPVSGTLTFAADVLSQTFSVPILDNALVDGNRSVALTLGVPSFNATRGSPASAVLTITSDDVAGSLRFSSATYSVNENAGSVSLTVLRSGGAAGGVLVDFTIEDGTAKVGQDYGGLSGTLSFGAGNNSATITIPIIPDQLAEGNETFRVVLSNPRGGATLGTPAAATVTINDVAGSLQFATASYSVPESAGSVTLTVQRTGGLGAGVLVDFTIEDVTTTVGLDYVALSGTLSFGAGNTSATITVQITADALAEGDETFRVVLGNPRGGATLGLLSTATVTIVDAQSVIQFSAGSYAVGEGTATAVVTVVRSGSLSTAATVTFTASPGTAVAVQDFTPVSTVLTFVAGQTSRTASVPIRNNPLAQGNRSVILGLAGPLVGALSNAVLTIVDDDQGGIIRLNPASYRVGESAGSVVVTIVRALTGVGSLASNVSVDYTTGNISALSGLDYTARAGTLTFNAGETMKTVTVPILADALVEGAETFSFTLSNPTGGASLGTPATATITIDDDDVGGQLKFSSATYPVKETAGTVTLTVQRIGGAASGVLVDFATQDVTATAGSDYTATTGTLTFLAGNMSATIAILIGQDQLAEGDETFRVVLSNARGGATLGAPSVAVVTIGDDESAIQFNAPAYTVREAPTGASITLVRSGVLAATTVTFTATPGTAVPGLDFTQVSTVLTFAAGQASRMASVPILNNTLAQGNRTVMLGVTGAQVGTQANAVLTIIDDDQGGTIRFNPATYRVSEAASSVVVTIVRALSGVGSLASNVSVDFTTMNGSALSGLDYVAQAGTLTFVAGEAMKTVTVPILRDTLVEGVETFAVVLSNPTGGASLGTPVTATVTIDDDDVGGQLRFASATAFVSEGGGSVTLTVQRIGGAASGVLVDFATQDITATAPGDYTATTGTLTFLAGNMSLPITIPISQDTLAEGDETFQVVLSNVRGGATLSTPAVAVVTIGDDESTLQFNAPTYTAREGMPSAVVTVLRSGAMATQVTVTFTATPLTAVPGRDFTPVSGTLTFPPKIASKTFNVPVLNDPLVDGNRTVMLSLGVPTGGAQLGPQATSELTIVDDDQGGIIRLGSATATVGESAGSVMLTIMRALSAAGGSLAGNVTVSYATGNGSALSGLDYTARAGTLTFSATETTKTVSVPILGDRLVEGAETFTFTLSNPTGGALLGTPVTTTVTITDDDTGGLVALASAAIRVDEGAGNTSIRVVRSGNTGHPGTVDYTLSGGTATTGVDYAPPVAGTLTFATGQTEAFIPLAILQDSLLENNETLNVRLVNPQGGLQLGAPVTGVVTIVDDDAVAEFSGRFLGNMPEVVRRGSLQGQVTVDFTMTDGTAVSGEDYAPVSGTLTFAPGVAAQAVPLRIINDDIAEGPETFTITLSNPAPADSTRLGANASRTFTIGDNDFGGVVQFGAAAYAAAEGGSVTVTITRLGGLGTTLTVGWAVTGGTATPGTDFTPASGNVTFGLAETSQTFTINVLADGVTDAGETVQLGLSVPGGGAAQIGAPATAVLTITTDN